MSQNPAPQTTRGGPPADFGFLFDGGGDGMCVEADTLAAALRQRPDLSPERLQEVWCLHTCNLVWGFVDDPTPWKDPEPAHAR
jgi:hypothetical protein